MKSDSVLGTLVRVDFVQKNYVKRAPDKLREGLTLIDGRLQFIPPYIELVKKALFNEMEWNSFETPPAKPMVVRVWNINAESFAYSYWNGKQFGLTSSYQEDVSQHDRKSIYIYEDTRYGGWLPL